MYICFIYLVVLDLFNEKVSSVKAGFLRIGFATVDTEHFSKHSILIKNSISINGILDESSCLHMKYDGVIHIPCCYADGTDILWTRLRLRFYLTTAHTSLHGMLPGAPPLSDLI